MKKDKKMNLNIIALNILLMVYSMSGICSKFAAKAQFLSIKFILCYGIFLFLLVFYAFGWQQIIKKMPLTTAYANKAITIVWGMIWGVLFFQEEISIKKIFGALVVVIGVVLYAKSDETKEDLLE